SASPVASPSDQAAEIARLRRELDRTRMERDVLKKLGRQNWLLGLLFEGGEVGVGIAAEAGSCGPRLPADVEGSA
ncbi:hypothetical protein FV234_26010, partial [Methylobacterium sp. WL8]